MYDLTGGIQEIILPETIDINDSMIIGMIIIFSSLIFIILGLEWEDHIVTRLNRIE